jgi:hypothetical protein
LEGHCGRREGRSRKKLAAAFSTRPNAGGNVGWSESDDFMYIPIVPEWQRLKTFQPESCLNPTKCSVWHVRLESRPWGKRTSSLGMMGGISGQLVPDSVDGTRRNQWTACAGLCTHKDGCAFGNNTNLFA